MPKGEGISSPAPESRKKEIIIPYQGKLAEREVLARLRGHHRIGGGGIQSLS